MAYSITQNDIALLYNHDKDLWIKLELLEKNNDSDFIVIDTIQGTIISGDYSEDAESDVRRTINFSMIQVDKSYTVGEYNRIWVDKFVRIYFGQKNSRTKQISYYVKGIFVFNDAQTIYSGQDNSITVSCSDLVSTLDGTHSGQIDAVEILIPQGSIIRDAIIQTITQLGGIKNYRVDEIGEYTCLEGVCEDYLKRREIYPEWNQVPCDLEFSTGATVWEIITKLKDLYPGNEAFFDEEGIFVCQRIPNCDADDVILTNDLIQPLIINESSTIDLSSVRNVTKIYGKSIETDRYSENCVTDGNVYHVCLDDFVLTNNMVIGVLVDTDNIENMMLSVVNSNGEIIVDPINIVERKVVTIVKDTSGDVIIDNNIPNDMAVEIEPQVFYASSEVGKFEAGKVYCFKYASCLNTGETEKHMYWVYQGQYQIEALYKNEDEDTAFCVQKIGERLQVLSGGEFENIMTDALAMENASYQTWLKSRLNETISLELIDIPFLSVNTKIEYTPKNTSVPEYYIIKNIQESFMNGVMTIEMMKFYRLYPNFLGLRKYG